MPGEKVALHGAQETLLVTLCAKAGESRLSDSLLKDDFAAAAVARIDYDFDRLQVDRDLMIGVALRAHVIDRWTRDFLARHPDATVLHLGCGLDSRVFRIAPPPAVRWFDVDFPAVIALRRRLYPPRQGYVLLASSVTEPGWLGAVPQDRPALVIAEGILPYLPEEEVMLLLERVTGHLPGGELVFDAYSRLGLAVIAWQPSIRATGAKLLWSLDEPLELLGQLPGLELVEELAGYGPGGYDMAQVARMSLFARLAVPVMGMIPALARIGRLLRCRF